MHHRTNLMTTSRASRLFMLNNAYDSSKRAVTLCPNSLSCVALKACLAISRLVENAAVISRKVGHNEFRAQSKRIESQSFDAISSR